MGGMGSMGKDLVPFLPFLPFFPSRLRWSVALPAPNQEQRFLAETGVLAARVLTEAEDCTGHETAQCCNLSRKL
jgi:hypothetical protein